MRWTRREAWIASVAVGLAVFCGGMLWVTASEGSAARGRSSLSPCGVVRRVFEPDGAVVGREACRVAGCESAGDASGRVLRPWARTGQYLGLFQLGAWARASFLHRRDGPWYGSWANAKAARRLWLWNGRSWRGQWACAWAA